MTIKTIFISYDGLTDPLGQSQILPYLKGLSSKGYHITILSCEKKDAFDKNSALVKSICEEAKINWEYIFYTKKPPILSTYLDLSRMKNKALQLHRKENFSIVHCRSIMTTSVGYQLQKKGAKLIFDIRGFWAEERIDGKLWHINNPLHRIMYNYFKQKQIKYYTIANHIVTLTKSAKQFIQKEYPIADRKISVIPCTVDLNHFVCSDKINRRNSSVYKELKITEDDFIVCYSGSLGTRYLIEEMLLCFKMITAKFVNARFLIVTHSNTKELEALAKKIQVFDRLIITSTTYKEVPKYISSADIALYFIYEGNSGKAVSPTKQAEFLSMGVPIITNGGIGDSKEILENNKVGLVTEDFDEKSFQQLVERIPEILNQPQSEIVKIAKKYFNLEQGIETYNEVYQGLLTENTK